jgi:broad specificity phosphatase PhoE
MLRDAGVGAIYSTSFARTRKTAEPLATALELPIGNMPSSIEAWVAHLRGRHADAVVVVVGHSNTVPEILQELGVAGALRIADDEYDNLFIVIPGSRDGATDVVRLRY